MEIQKEDYSTNPSIRWQARSDFVGWDDAHFDDWLDWASGDADLIWDKKEVPGRYDIIDKGAENRTPLALYCVYAYEDKPLRDQLEKYLSLQLRWGLISQWYDRQIVVGTGWTARFDEYPEMASIILLLISSDF